MFSRRMDPVWGKILIGLGATSLLIGVVLFNHMGIR